MKLNIYFRANESAKSAGSINKDITKESYRVGNYTKEDILKATWLSVNNSGIDDNDRIFNIDFVIKFMPIQTQYYKQVMPIMV